jgi:outer membrane lipopolysaccharide assembly protein LptE/RlpB
MKLRAGLLVINCLLITGCGYHTAGHTTTIPQDVRTIAVPAFVNQTQTFKIEQMLTAAVVRELVTRTHYRVLNQVNDDADAALRGTVLSTYTTPLTYDSQTGRAASVLVVISQKVALTDKQGASMATGRLRNETEERKQDME